MSELSKEKFEWMEKVGFKKFERPMVYYLGANQVFSEEYIKNTPLEKLKERYERNSFSNKNVQEMQAHEQQKVTIGISNLNEFTDLVNQTIGNLNKVKNFKFEINKSAK